MGVEAQLVLVSAEPELLPICHRAVFKGFWLDYKCLGQAGGCHSSPIGPSGNSVGCWAQRTLDNIELKAVRNEPTTPPLSFNRWGN